MISRQVTNLAYTSRKIQYVKIKKFINSCSFIDNKNFNRSISNKSCKSNISSNNFLYKFNFSSFSNLDSVQGFEFPEEDSKKKKKKSPNKLLKNLSYKTDLLISNINTDTYESSVLNNNMVISEQLKSPKINHASHIVKIFGILAQISEECHFDAKKVLLEFLLDKQNLFQDLEIEFSNELMKDYSTLHKILKFEHLDEYKKLFINKFLTSKFEDMKFYIEFLNIFITTFKNDIKMDELEIIIQKCFQMNLNKTQNFSQKLSMNFSLITGLNYFSKDIEFFKDEKWLPKIEGLFFALMNEFRKMPLKSIVTHEIIELNHIMNFFSPRYQTEKDWKSINSLIKINNNTFSKIEDLYKIVKNSYPNLKYFDYKFLLENYQIEEIFKLEESRVCEFIQVYEFFMKFEFFVTFKKDLIKKAEDVFEKELSSDPSMIGKMIHLFNKLNEVDSDVNFLEINKLLERMGEKSEQEN
jgi:hypothetical protein